MEKYLIESIFKDYDRLTEARKEKAIQNVKDKRNRTNESYRRRRLSEDVILGPVTRFQLKNGRAVNAALDMIDEEILPNYRNEYRLHDFIYDDSDEYYIEIDRASENLIKDISELLTDIGIKFSVTTAKSFI